MASIEHQRWNAALNRVKKIERTSGLLRARFLPRTFAYAKRSAWASPEGLASLPQDQQHKLPADGKARGRVRAESLLVGKFDVQAEVRLRAFYPDQGLSVRYQTGGPNNGVLRTFNAYENVAPHAPALMPKIYEHGEILKGRGAFLVEETVSGETATRAELEQLILPLTSQLHRAQRGVGISDKKLSDVLGHQARERWNDFVNSRSIDTRIDQSVQNLLDRDDFLEVSVTHGDLVNSNILVDGKDYILVDWEWASFKPIAFDMAKMIINVYDIDAVLKDMYKGLGGSLGSTKTHFTFREQVALALVQNLTFYKRQSVKAKKANRTDALERQTQKRVNALRHLLEIE